MDGKLILTQTIQEYIKQKNIIDLREIFDEYNIVDLADIVDQLDVYDIIFIFKTVTKDVTGQLFSYLDNDVIEHLLEVLNSDQIKVILNSLYSDDLIDFLQELPANLSKKVLNSASSQQKKLINELLQYQEDTAGSIMSTNYLELSKQDNINDAIEKIKRYGSKAETIGTCFVLNEKGRLVGIVTLRDILFASEDNMIKDIMDIDYNSVFTSTDTEEVGRMMQKYDENVIAVTDEDYHLLGMITIDDIIDVMQEEATEDIHRMAAITPIEFPYLEASTFKLAQSRLVWLMLLMVSYALSSIIITNNDQLLMMVPSLITFIPMLMDTAGNAGSQASAMVIRGIIVDSLTIKDFFKVVFKEMMIALMTGSVLFIVNMIRIVIFVNDVGFDIAVIVSLSVFLVVLIAKLSGALFPMLALIIKVDPAIMASPLITTTCDLISILAYFGLARLWLGI
ncbi:MAG: magnesium transporter [Erysipelotrichaceae bacterium]|nr:magnesium transporter [Erysipelotrichaceae bacterium]